MPHIANTGMRSLNVADVIIFSLKYLIFFLEVRRQRADTVLEHERDSASEGIF